jgi:hypothetical protein
LVDIQNNIEPMVGAFSCDRVLAIHSKERDDALETAGTHYKPGDVRIESSYLRKSGRQRAGRGVKTRETL